MYEQLRRQLTQEEGKRLKKYKCTKGHWTIGIGHNLDASPNFKGVPIPAEITEELCNAIFEADTQRVVTQLAKAWPYIDQLDPARRDAVLNMAFQMGVAGVMTFKGMLRALELKNWIGAQTHALDSAWAKQTPNRAKRVAKQLRTGEYY